MKAITLSGITRHAGGLFYAVRSLCQGLHKKDVEISVLGHSDSDVEEDAPTWQPVSALAYKGFGPLAYSTELRSIFKKESPDLIHQHGIWLGDQWASLQWQKITNKPVVISPHGMLDPWALKNSSWKKNIVGKLFANKSLHRATCLHALCVSEAESIREYGLTNPIAIIPNGIDLPILEQSVVHQNDVVPQSLEESQQRRKKLLFLGRIHPKKGLNELIGAWERVVKESPEQMTWELIIAGWDDGGHETGLKQQVASLGLSDSIKFVGAMFGDAKELLLREVDAFILPSFSEGLPMSVLEAWAYQLPVVMTEFCNIPEGFEAEAAIHIDPTPLSIATGLQKMINLPESDLRGIGQKGRKLVENKFTWDQIAEQMKGVYEWCVSGKKPPKCIRFYK
ncbi:MAG: glycosyltransferase involved in cell wall biosynthesis [Oceanospirillaceae bacterium]|jgi:glycosyltransferase involved in cell wall biosynthesis